MPLFLLIILAAALWAASKTEVGDAVVSKVLGNKVLRQDRLQGVHPELVSAVLKWNAEGPFTIMVGSGVRTQAQQEALYAQGRTKPGTVVTNASSAASSPHGRGAAVDLWPVDDNGSPLFTSEAEGLYKLIGEWFEALGFEWGGKWASLKDLPHVEMRNWRNLPFPPQYP